jgi:DNA helicase-2/ATP-dependent DNA helicase PcrA
MQLTEQQKKIVHIEEYTDNSKICLLASAGSGKSVTLAYRIENLIKNKQVSPQKIAMFSYSKTASKEFREKLKDLLGSKVANLIEVSTIHALAHKYVTKYSNSLGFKYIQDYITDSFECQIFYKFLKEDNNDDSFLQKEAKSIVQRLNYCKVKKLDYSFSQYGSEEIEIYNKVDKWCLSKNLISFNNLLILLLRLVKENKTVRDEISNNWDYIFIDESQDTTILQMDIFKEIINDNHHLMTVGDIQQTIYEFAGSDPYYYLNYLEKIKADIFQLNETFRFGNTVVDYANKIVERVLLESKYKIKTVTNQKSEEVKIINREEIIDNIQELIKRNVALENISILARTNSELTAYEKDLTDNNIPCFVASGNFYRRTEIQVLLKHFLLLKQYNITDLHFILKYLNNKIDIKTLEIVHKSAENNEIEIDNVLDFFEYCLNYNIKGIGVTRKKAFQEEYGKFNSLKLVLDQNNNENLDLDNIIEIIDFEKYRFMGHEINTKTGLSNHTERFENLYMLSTMYSKYNNNIYDFIKKIKLEYENKDTTEKGKVVLRTTHRSKGMTISYNFLDLSNFGKYSGSIEDYTSEMYLAYVGITRAKNQLILILDEIQREEHFLNFLFGYENEFSYNFKNVDFIDQLTNVKNNKKGYFDLNDNEDSKENSYESICLGNYSANKYPHLIIINKILKITEKAVLIKIQGIGKPFFTPKTCIAFNRENKNVYANTWLKNKYFQSL